MVLRFLTLLGLTLSLTLPLFADENQRGEYQVKALFLYNFANFVEWPEDAFKETESPIEMCLFGNVPFSAFMDVVDGTLIGDRELHISTSQNIKDIENGCHILFVGEDQRLHLREFFKQIKYVYVLSVGNQKGFADQGGIINILRTTDQLEFEINITNAMQSGLFISSDLLSLAREIKRHSKK